MGTSVDPAQQREGHGLDVIEVGELWTRWKREIFLACVWVRGRGNVPARAGKLGGERCFRAVREGFVVIASNACFGPFPLLVWVGGFGG